MPYRDSQIRMGYSPPTICTRRGELIRSDGLMDPSSRIDLSRGNKKSGFIFGAQPASAREDFVHAEEDVEAIDEALPLLKELDELTQQLNEVMEREDEIVSKRAQLQLYELEQE